MMLELFQGSIDPMLQCRVVLLRRCFAALLVFCALLLTSVTHVEMLIRSGSAVDYSRANLSKPEWLLPSVISSDHKLGMPNCYVSYLATCPKYSPDV